MVVLTDVIARDLIRVLGLRVAIAKHETCLNLKPSETYHKLEEDGLFMPTPAIMTQHYTSVKAAVENGGILEYSSGEPVTEADVNDLYRRIVLGQKGGVWTHLDAFFVRGSGAQWLDMVTDHRAIMNGDEKQIVAWKREPLLPHVAKRVCFVDPVFNEQGLPTTTSNEQEYKLGKNLFYLAPVYGRVARFNAYSKVIVWDFDGAPNFSDNALGVLACMRLRGHC